MFIIIPFVIFFGSLGAIFWIVTRKFVYLKKLTPQALDEALDATNNGYRGFYAELLPGLADRLKKINPRAYGVNILTNFEKFLRKLRLISSQIDTLTSQLINKIRKSTKKHEEILNRESLIREKLENENDDLEELINDQEDLKLKEQLLIIEIAKNPKDPQLYKELGIVYMRAGEWDDARQSFEKALELEPGDETAKRKLGRVLGKLKSFE